VTYRAAFDAFDRVGLWDKYEHYFEVYDRYLRTWQGRKVRMLELGVDRGGSIAGWREYFGAEHLEYYGVDIDPGCKRFERDGVRIFTGDLGDRAFAEGVAAELPPLDLVVDDGGHVAIQQATSFTAFFPRLVSGGVYIVEDTHTSFWREYRSPLEIRGATETMGAIDYFCALTRLMMERWWDESSRSRFNIPRHERTPVESGEHARDIYSMSFFDSLVVVEKRDVPEPLRIRRK
jgi:methyltransferase family protein